MNTTLEEFVEHLKRVGSLEEKLTVISNQLQKLVEALSSPQGTQSKQLPTMLYTRKEAAQMLGMSVGNVDLLIGNGHLRARRIGRLVRISQQELTRLQREDVLHVTDPSQRRERVKQ